MFDVRLLLVVLIADGCSAADLCSAVVVCSAADLCSDAEVCRAADVCSGAVSYGGAVCVVLLLLSGQSGNHKMGTWPGQRCTNMQWRNMQSYIQHVFCKMGWAGDK